MSEFVALKGFRSQVCKSLERALALFLLTPNLSFSRTLGNSFRQTIAALFSDERMNADVLQQSHRQATLSRAIASEDEFFIAIQDTCYFNYRSHHAMTGLGYIQGSIKGIVMHATILTDSSGTMLGVLGQKFWSRKSEMSFEGKESKKWDSGLQAAKEAAKDIKRPIVLTQDREGDIFDYIRSFQGQQQEQYPVHLLVRTFQPRSMELAFEDEKCFTLEQATSVLPVHEQTLQTTIERKGKIVTLTLSLQSARVHLLAGQRKDRRSQELSLVIAKETAAVDQKGNDVFDAAEASVWYLLSTLPCNSYEDVCRMVTCYSKRWCIERFHYTLKSGSLNVERLQFETLKATVNALSFYSVVAAQLLGLTQGLKKDGEQPAVKYYDEEDMALLRASQDKEINTVKEATVALGRLVGFVPTKRQPIPGIRILTEALQKLYYMKTAVRLMNKDKPLQP